MLVANRSGVSWSWDSTDYVAAGRSIANFKGSLDVSGLPMTVRLRAIRHSSPWVNSSVSRRISPAHHQCGVRGHLLDLRLSHRCPVRLADGCVHCGCICGPHPHDGLADLDGLERATIHRRTRRDNPRGTVVPTPDTIRDPRCVVRSALLPSLRRTVLIAPIAVVAVLTDAKSRGWIRSIALHASTLAVSIIPMAWWLARNHRIDGTLTGARQPGGVRSGNAHPFIRHYGTFISAQPFDSVIYERVTNYPLPHNSGQSHHW